MSFHRSTGLTTKKNIFEHDTVRPVVFLSDSFFTGFNPHPFLSIHLPHPSWKGGVGGFLLKGSSSSLKQFNGGGLGGWKPAEGFVGDV